MNSVAQKIFRLTLLGSLLLTAGIFLAPVLDRASHPLGKALYLAYSPFCHQIESRCFVFLGGPLAVCARCLGIYTGFLVGTFTFPFLYRRFIRAMSIKTLVFFSLPVVFDTAGNLLHIWASPGGLRLVTGLIWGSILPFFFIRGLTDLFIEIKQKKSIE